MKPVCLLVIFFFTTSLCFTACGGKDKKQTTGTTETKTTSDNMVSNIDTASLKDEASILAAMQQVTDARIADEKKQKEDAGYKDHYVELLNLYTAVLKASTAYSKSIQDPAEAVEFGKKLSAIQDKMYVK